jgi:hypothetical protein
MMRPSSEKPGVNWDHIGHASESAGEQASVDERWGHAESEARSSTSARISPLVWGAAAFAGAVAVGLVLRGRQRSRRWPALLTVNITPPPAPARSALWSTIGSAAARIALGRLMAQRGALLGVEPVADAPPWTVGATADPQSSAASGGRHPS